MDLLPRYSDDRLLGYLTPHERAYLVNNTVAHTLAPGEVLIRQGDTDETMFLIEEGELEAIDEHLGHDAVIGSLLPGTVLGEMAFLAHMPRSATVRARTAAVVRAFQHANIQFIALEAPEILGKVSLAIAEILSERLRDTIARLPELVASLQAARDVAGEHCVSKALDDAAESIARMDRRMRPD